ncbi:MAG: hypothetical protein LBE92_12315 [Chryseobacterium sp.]|jgi:hypothetical protein|uniref:hypothetical protein n=1 Tax=Chryseobacterium sp. TaxID=1871047 RepID=UPI00282FAF01|nr:hypothetical protein [Chryseobacterium sp.]MDR2236900.1 hypothetical protein [Chryseobacterium sp.]
MKKMTEKALKKGQMNSITGGNGVITPGNPGFTQPTPPAVVYPQPIGGIPYMYTLPPNGLPNNGWIIPK